MPSVSFISPRGGVKVPKGGCSPAHAPERAQYLEWLPALLCRLLINGGHLNTAASMQQQQRQSASNTVGSPITGAAAGQALHSVMLDADLQFVLMLQVAAAQPLLPSTAA